MAFKVGISAVQVNVVNHGGSKGGKASNETLALRNGEEGVFWPDVAKNRTTWYRTLNSKFYSLRQQGYDVHMRKITLLSDDYDYVTRLHSSNYVKLNEPVLNDDGTPICFKNFPNTNQNPFPLGIVDRAILCCVDARFVDANGNLVFHSEPSVAID